MSRPRLRVTAPLRCASALRAQNYTWQQASCEQLVRPSNGNNFSGFGLDRGSSIFNFLFIFLLFLIFFFIFFGLCMRTRLFRITWSIGFPGLEDRWPAIAGMVIAWEGSGHFLFYDFNLKSSARFARICPGAYGADPAQDRWRFTHGLAGLT